MCERLEGLTLPQMASQQVYRLLFLCKETNVWEWDCSNRPPLSEPHKSAFILKEFACSPRPSVGFPRAPRRPPPLQKQSSQGDWFCVIVWPCGRACPGCPPPSPNSSQVRPRRPPWPWKRTDGYLRQQRCSDLPLVKNHFLFRWDLFQKSELFLPFIRRAESSTFIRNNTGFYCSSKGASPGSHWRTPQRS